MCKTYLTSLNKLRKISNISHCLTNLDIEIIIPTNNDERIYFPHGPGSEQVHMGAHDQENRSTDRVERSLSLIWIEMRLCDSIFASSQGSIQTLQLFSHYLESYHSAQ